MAGALSTTICDCPFRWTTELIEVLAFSAAAFMRSPTRVIDRSDCYLYPYLFHMRDVRYNISNFWSSRHSVLDHH
jgi:hypothetical protein